MHSHSLLASCICRCAEHAPLSIASCCDSTHTNETRRAAAAASVTLTCSWLSAVPAPPTTQKRVEAAQLPVAVTLVQVPLAAGVGSTVSMRNCSCGSESPAQGEGW